MEPSQEIAVRPQDDVSDISNISSRVEYTRNYIFDAGQRRALVLQLQHVLTNTWVLKPNVCGAAESTEGRM